MGSAQYSQALIDKVKQSGFNAIRIPCNWNWSHVPDSTTAKIDPAWLSRVQQVVQYCINDGMYVILNIYWDGGWLENHVTTTAQAAVNAKQKALWEQIATQLRGFDQHLIFASANEPAVTDAHVAGKCLEIYGWNGANGGIADIWAYTGTGGNNQNWLIQPTDNGYYKIINVNSGKALEVASGSSPAILLRNGSAVDQSDYTGGKNQQWGFVKI